MKKYLTLTLIISVLVGIVLPNILRVKDPFYVAISFSLVWAIYSLIMLGYVFLVEGRQNRNRLQTRKEDPFPPSMIQEWEALWEITIKRSRDPRMGNSEWN